VDETARAALLLVLAVNEKAPVVRVKAFAFYDKDNVVLL
jgi:hypothetical protein